MTPHRSTLPPQLKEQYQLDRIRESDKKDKMKETGKKKIINKNK